MDFKIVPETYRDKVTRGRNLSSEWMKALIEGKTIVISKEDRDRIGGNTKTLKNRGLRLRTGMISETEVVAWTEQIGSEDDH